MIVFVGDLHGTPEALRSIASGLGLVDADLKWTAENVRLVLTGDVCDRGRDSAAIFRLLINWQQAAGSRGSEVVFLIGNHELMNLQGLTYYNTAAETASYGGTADGSFAAEKAVAFSPGGWVYEWLREQSFIVKTDAFIISHADFSTCYRDMTIEQINKRCRREVFEDIEDHAGASETEINFTERILWSREAREHRPDYEHELEQFLKRNGAEYWVCGHTPSLDGEIKTAHNGRYICIDTAMFFRGDKSSALVYEEGRLEAVYFTGPEIVGRAAI